jgi:hypothetical protein
LDRWQTSRLGVPSKQLRFGRASPREIGLQGPVVQVILDLTIEEERLGNREIASPAGVLLSEWRARR